MKKKYMEALKSIGRKMTGYIWLGLLICSFFGTLIGIWLILAGYHAADTAVNILWLSYNYNTTYYYDLEDQSLGGGSVLVQDEYVFGMASLFQGIIIAIAMSFIFGYSLIGLYGHKN